MVPTLHRGARDPSVAPSHSPAGTRLGLAPRQHGLCHLAVVESKPLLVTTPRVTVPEMPRRARWPCGRRKAAWAASCCTGCPCSICPRGGPRPARALSAEGRPARSPKGCKPGSAGVMPLGVIGYLVTCLDVLEREDDAAVDVTSTSGRALGGRCCHLAVAVSLPPLLPLSDQEDATKPRHVGSAGVGAHST